MTLIYGKDEYFTEWVRQQVPIVGDQRPCTAIGIVRNERIVAAVVYNNYRRSCADIQMSMASISPRWASRENIAGLFAYPFVQLECRRVTAFTLATNHPVREFLCRVGFTLEGVMREYLDGQDTAAFGMLRRECFWLKQELPLGQRFAVGAVSA